MNGDLSSLQVQDLGEQKLLQILQGFCPPEIIGDDAAVLSTPPEQSLVVTTDVLIENVHFSEVTTSGKDVGWRSATANLSDLAAMGAYPLGITVGLGLPGSVRVSWVEELYKGMTECLQQYNTPIVGGDVVRSPVITIAITAFGQADPLRLIRRAQAKVGDVIIVTGVHGAASAGLELLLHPESVVPLSNADRNALVKAHQRPQPRLDVLPTLFSIFNSSTLPISSLPISGMDSSDGLADAVVQICHASGVGAVIERTQIPLPTAFDNWLTNEQALLYALYGGEDFELVLCLPKEPAHELVQQLGNGAGVIGTITDEPTVVLRDQKEKYPDQVLTLNQGFQHFS